MPMITEEEIYSNFVVLIALVLIDAPTTIDCHANNHRRMWNRDLAAVLNMRTNNIHVANPNRVHDAFVQEQ